MTVRELIEALSKFDPNAEVPAEAVKEFYVQGWDNAIARAVSICEDHACWWSSDGGSENNAKVNAADKLACEIGEEA